MNDYLGRNKTEKKKESVIGAIKKQKVKDREEYKNIKKRLNAVER